MADSVQREAPARRREGKLALSTAEGPLPLARMVLLRDVDNDTERKREKERKMGRIGCNLCYTDFKIHHIKG